MIRGIRELVDKAYLEGREQFSYFRKVPAIAAVAGNWVDLSMAPGNPRPNYYATAELTAEYKDYRYGLYHGGNVSPLKKYLHKVGIFCNTAGGAPATWIMCDYLLYYPLIDMDNTEDQIFDNTKAIQRYTGGEGVMAFLVASNPYIGNVQFTINYTNQNGVAERISRPARMNTAGLIATIVNSGVAGALHVNGPFIPLAQGDTGIRSVQSINFQNTAGGLGVLVLCKPLATFMTLETTAPAEFDFIKDKLVLPVIEDGAYLNLLCNPSATIAGAFIQGDATFVWG